MTKLSLFNINSQIESNTFNTSPPTSNVIQNNPVNMISQSQETSSCSSSSNMINSNQPISNIISNNQEPTSNMTNSIRSSPNVVNSSQSSANKTSSQSSGNSTSVSEIGTWEDVTFTERHVMYDDKSDDENDD